MFPSDTQQVAAIGRSGVLHKVWQSYRKGRQYRLVWAGVPLAQGASGGHKHVTHESYPRDDAVITP